ncbi:MAG: hypothetical protein HHJ13_10805 [Phycicoccus sp.]|nr:hypothetical protein [Phycicoccus sp.]
MAEEEPPTTTAAAEQALARLAGLARIALQTQASLAKQSVDLARGTLSGDLDRTSAGRAYVESVSREGARYWRAVGELGVDYATDLVALGKSVSSTVMREMAAAGRKPGTRHTSGTAADHTHSSGHHVMPEGGGPQAPNARTSGESSSGVADQEASPRRVKVRLRGPVGGRAEGTITVANQHPRPRRIQLSAGDLVDSSGGLVGAALAVSPATVTVPSGKERSVSLGVALDDGSFSAGERYSCTVDVTGGDEATIEVTIEVS